MQHARLEFLTIVVDELNRQDGQGLIGSPLIPAVALIEELGELGRIGLRRAVGQLIAILADNAGLRCIGYDELQRIDMRERHEVLIVLIGTHDFFHTGDDTVLRIGLAVLLTAQADGIEIILPAEALRYTLLRHNNGYAAVQTEFLIGDINAIVEERPQEVPFPDLQESNRMMFSFGNFTYVFHFFASFLPLLTHHSVVKAKITSGIIIGNILYELAQELHICRILAVLHEITDPVAENAAIIFMTRIGKEGTGVGKHAQDIAQNRKVSNIGKLLDHAAFRIIEPPGSTLLNLAGNLRSLEGTDDRADHRIVNRIQ